MAERYITGTNNPANTMLDERAAVEARIRSRLPALSQAALQQLDLFTTQMAAGQAEAEANQARNDPPVYTRRQMLAGAAAGMVLLTATGVGTARLGFGLGEKKGQIEQLGELGHLRDLVRLYGKLDSLDLDDVLAAGLRAISFAISALIVGAHLLAAGAQLVRNGLAAVEQAIPVLVAGLRAAEEVLQNVEKQLGQLGDLLGRTANTVRPLTDALGGFFREIISHIPGAGPHILATIDHLSGMISALPGALGQLKDNLLAPLHAGLLSQGETGLQRSLIDPLHTKLLKPLDDYIVQVNTLDSQWQQNMMLPVNNILTQRATLRNQIAELHSSGWGQV
ncbi:MAG: hypothetical protein EXR62_05320 [Chloroflexi bacterium]|nr:hypothetical protein [Chloroflexota bacterium]